MVDGLPAFAVERVNRKSGAVVLNFRVYANIFVGRATLAAEADQWLVFIVGAGINLNFTAIGQMDNNFANGVLGDSFQSSLHLLRFELESNGVANEAAVDFGICLADNQQVMIFRIEVNDDVVHWREDGGDDA